MAGLVVPGGGAAAAVGLSPGAWRLPPLREDLSVLPGAAAEDGAPTWMVYDALRHRFFRIGLAAFRLLGRWRAGEDSAAFLAEVNQDGVDVDSEDLQGLVQFLVANQLTQAVGEGALRQLRQQHERSRQGWLMWLLHHYLFIRIPLWRPDAFLTRTLPWVAPLCSAPFLWMVRLSGLVGALLVLQQWEAFAATFLHFFSYEGLLCYGLTLGLVKVAHELGHAYAARRQGLRVASVGVAFLVLFPVLYTDTTDAWRLRYQRDRLRIVAAGVMVELHLAMFALLAWSFLPDGPLRSAAFFLATTSLVTSLMVNLSPFMRFDGYFALCDLIKAENLQPRAFAMARWHLRETLFGLDDPAPEALSSGRRHLFIAYAYATWVYRFFLFIGIALLVYHFAFKLLGILLFIVEIWWFVMKPLHSELSAWWGLRQRLHLNGHTVVTAGLLLAGLAGLVLPWRPTIGVPAVLEAGEYRQVFPAERARLVAVQVTQGQSVQAGQLLMRLENPGVEQALQLSQRRLELLKLKVGRRAGSEGDLRNLQTLEEQQQEEEARRDALLRKRRLLEVRAPIAGTVSLPAALEPGRWVEANLQLLSIRSDGGARLIGYLPEAVLDRVELGAPGAWIANFGTTDRLRVTLARIDATAVPTLSYPELASDHGGPIPARANTDGSLRPENALYRVELTLDEPTASPPQRLPGLVRLQGKPRSVLADYLLAAEAILVKEGGF